MEVVGAAARVASQRAPLLPQARVVQVRVRDPPQPRGEQRDPARVRGEHDRLPLVRYGPFDGPSVRTLSSPCLDQMKEQMELFQKEMAKQQQVSAAMEEKDDVLFSSGRGAQDPDTGAHGAQGRPRDSAHGGDQASE